MTPRPRHRRLPGRKAVTIIAGFKSEEGIILCADTQETIGSSKRNVNKLRLEPKTLNMERSLMGIDIAAAFCGAGDGPFIDMLIDETWKAVATATTLDEACEYAKRAIEAVYRKYGEIYQKGECPYVEIIYGIKGDGDSRMFMASGPTVVPKDGYESSGTGRYLANYLASRMYGSSLNIYQCFILAAYILVQTKSHSDGCGGESHIAVLRNDGQSGLIDSRHIEIVTDLLESADIHIGRLLLHSADLTKNEEAVKTSSDGYLDAVTSLRKFSKESLDRSDEHWRALMTYLMGQNAVLLEKDIFGLYGPRAHN